MPIYEYVCQKCGHDFEVMQKMSDKPLTRCPKCRGRLEKIISQTSFQLKGSGWYISDYARKSSQKETTEQKDKTESAAATDSSDSKKEKSAVEKSGSDNKSEKTAKDSAKDTAKNAKSSPKSSD